MVNITVPVLKATCLGVGNLEKPKKNTDFQVVHVFQKKNQKKNHIFHEKTTKSTKINRLKIMYLFLTIVSHPVLCQRNWWCPRDRCLTPNQPTINLMKLSINHRVHKSPKHVFWGVFPRFLVIQRINDTLNFLF